MAVSVNWGPLKGLEGSFQGFLGEGCFYILGGPFGGCP